MRWPCAVLLLVPALAGCASAASEDAGPAERPAPAAADPWGGTTRQTLLDLDGSSIQLDVLCVFGGGVEMQRNGGGRVLPGSDRVEAFVQVDTASTGAQLGYVLTEDPGYDEREQEGITWLEPVAAGGERLFTVPVREDQLEPPEGPLLWRFYLRMNVPTGENQPKADCYTGVHSGEMVLRAEAVRA